MSRKLINIYILIFLFIACCLASQGQFSPPLKSFSSTIKEANSKRDYIESDVTFQSALTSSSAINNTVHGIWFYPTKVNGSIPAVLLIHSWGSSKPHFEIEFGRELAKHRIAAFAMELPYHLHRTPLGSRSGQLMVTSNIDSLVFNVKQAVSDMSRSLDWISQQPNIDQSKIGLEGVSLGAIISALWIGVDNRWSSAALLVGGADVAHILWNSAITEDIRTQMELSGVTESTLRQRLIEIEPLTYLKNVDKKPLYLITGKYDQVIPPEDFQKLKSALGSPPTKTLNTGHFGPAFIKQSLISSLVKFFSNSFQQTAFEPPKHLQAETIRLGVFSHRTDQLRVSLGVDLFKFGKRDFGFSALILNPSEIAMFIGHRFNYGFAPGLVISNQGISAGLFWHSIL